jgi:hypothetical protein
MTLTEGQFRDAISYLTGVGTLSSVGALFINADKQKVLDELYDENKVRISAIDITPDAATLDQALVDLAAKQSNDAIQETTDNTAFADLLSKAQAGITQIATDKITVQNAAIPAEIKTVLDNSLKRQEEIIRAMAGAIRKLSL